MLFSSILQSAVNYFIPPKPLDWRNRDLKHSQVTVAGSIFEVNVPIQSTAAMNLTILLCFWRLITQVDLSISWCCYNIFLRVFLFGWLWLVVCFFFFVWLWFFFWKAYFSSYPISVSQTNAPSSHLLFLSTGKVTFVGVKFQGILTTLIMSSWINVTLCPGRYPQTLFTSFDSQLLQECCLLKGTQRLIHFTSNDYHQCISYSL